MLDQRIGFIGAGHMATALAQGILRAGLVAPDRLLASDVSEAARKRFAEATGAVAIADNAAVVAVADVVFFAVKPGKMADVAAELHDRIPPDRLLVSIAAGVRLASIAEWFGSELRIVRVMPNAPCVVGRGACGYSLGKNATSKDDALIGRLLGAVGAAWRVDENLLDAVTGLAGSGPAFVFVAIEALADGGVRMGLSRDVATAMAAHTVRGAAEMVLATDEHPAVLKDRVTSPAGTTIVGLQALESGGARAAMMAAVEAAARRSVELGARKG